MRLNGTNPIAWSNNDDQALGAEILPEHCLNAVATIDFDGIGKNCKLSPASERLRSVFLPHDLRFVSGRHFLEFLVHTIKDGKCPADCNPLHYQTLGLKSLKAMARASGLDKGE